jgi:GR25 family glycosyltransferase involved in LPS biosynthesis
MGSSRPIESKIEEAYYINLDNRPDRLINVIQAIDNSNLLKRICKRFPGIDGKLLSEQDLYSQITKKGKELLLSDQNRAGYLLTRGAIGLAMTYQKLIQSCNKITIFLEDDIHISKDFDSILEQCFNNIPDDWDILYLGYHHHSTRTILEPQNQYINKISRQVNGTFGWVLNPKSKDKLLSLYPITYQIDTEIHRLKTLNKYSTYKKIVYPNKNYASDIQEF